MILADAVAVAMFVGVIAYTLFAGADFGSGYYVLTVGGGVRGTETRRLVDHGSAPACEKHLRHTAACDRSQELVTAERSTHHPEYSVGLRNRAQPARLCETRGE